MPRNTKNTSSVPLSTRIEEELLQYIKRLKPPYQDVVNLRYFQEMSYNEISEKLEEPLNNVKVRLLRARKLLAEIITQQG